MTYPFYALLGLFLLTYVPFLDGFLIGLARDLIDKLDERYGDAFALALSALVVTLFGGMLLCLFLNAYWTAGCFLVTFLILLRVYTKS